MEVPICFQPTVVLREIMHFNDLQFHVFSGLEKDFICGQAMCECCSELQIEAFDEEPVYPTTMVGLILKRYNISRNRFGTWQKSIRRGQHNRDGTATGRRVDLDAYSLSIAKRTAIEAEASCHPLDMK